MIKIQAIDKFVYKLVNRFFCFFTAKFAVYVILFKEYFDYIISLALGQMCLIEVYFMHMKLFFSYQYTGGGFCMLLRFNLV